MLVGVHENVKAQLDRTETISEEDIFLANDTLGSSIGDALAAADEWLQQG
jgi:hypothetical protein